MTENGDKPGKSEPGDTKPNGSGASDDDVSSALRTAYDETLKEAIPDDMLDLLGKLD